MAQIIQQVISAIFGFQYTVDIIIGIFLLVCVFIGWKRGFRFQIWHTFFVILLLSIIYVTSLDALATFVNKGIFTTFNLEIPLSIGGTSHTINSLESFFTVISEGAVNAGTLTSDSLYADDAFISALAQGVSKALALFLVALLSLLLSWIISRILFALIFQPGLKKKQIKLKREGMRLAKFSFLGAILNLVSGVVYVLIFALSLSPIFHGIGSIANTQDPPYTFITQIGITIFKGLEPSNSKLIKLVIDPLSPGDFFNDVSIFEEDDTQYELTTTLSDYISATQAPDGD